MAQREVPERKPIVPSDTFSVGGECSDVPLPTDRDVPYVPTDDYIVNAMMGLARVGREDVVYDLGCGDGRICITAAKLGARAVGVEIDLKCLRMCQENLRNTGVRDRVEFRRESFFDTDLRPATVVCLYLLPTFNRKIRPKLLWELRPGARIVANYFEIADWVPDEKVMVKHRPLMLWIVPAWVGGEYKCVMTSEGGAEPRRHGGLVLKRNFQFVGGEMEVGRKRLKVEGRIRGTEVKLAAGEMEINAVYGDGALRGHWKMKSEGGVFVGQRIAAEAHASPEEFVHE